VTRAPWVALLVLAGCPFDVVDDTIDDDYADDDDATDDDDAMDDDDVAAPWEPFTLLTLNLHCLKQDETDFADLESRLGAIADFVLAEGVSVIALQEVCRRGETDALAILETALGADWTSAWTLAHVGWEGTPDEADEGLALLIRGEPASPSTLEYFNQAGLRRVAMVATLPPELGGLRVASVHLDVADAVVRAAQARESAVRIPTEVGLYDVVLAGDFNAPVDSPTIDAVKAQGYLDTTPSLDQTRIDHVFIHRTAGVAAAQGRLVFTGTDGPVVSDHPGVLVELSAIAVEVPTITRVVAHIDIGFGHYVALRGTLFPSTQWDVGWPMHPVADDRWELLLTEVPDGSAFEFKVLRDDADWQAGADVAGTGGTDNETTPEF
jgi:endonuclease/exonuclease/phosphatase family metal-dependent hydrolase